MAERGIDPGDVVSILRTGTVIKEYPDDTPYPSRLIAGWIAEQPVHSVAADNACDNEDIIITVYEPDPRKWEPDFLTRRRP